MIDFDALLLPATRDAFGEGVTIARSGGPTASVAGVFQDAYAGVEFGDSGPKHTTLDPNVGVRLSDVGWTPAQGDIVTRAKNGQRYRVVDVRPDGLGWTSLVLKATA